MSAIMKVLGLADGTEFSKEMWVESFNVDTEPDPTQMSSFTHDGRWHPERRFWRENLHHALRGARPALQERR